jgi:hypothetical protein
MAGQPRFQALFELAVSSLNQAVALWVVSCHCCVLDAQLPAEDAPDLGGKLRPPSEVITAEPGHPGCDESVRACRRRHVPHRGGLDPPGRPVHHGHDV